MGSSKRATGCFGPLPCRSSLASLPPTGMGNDDETYSRFVHVLIRLLAFKILACPPFHVHTKQVHFMHSDCRLTLLLFLSCLYGHLILSISSWGTGAYCSEESCRMRTSLLLNLSVIKEVSSTCFPPDNNEIEVFNFPLAKVLKW